MRRAARSTCRRIARTEALSALLFLYRNVLGSDLPWLEARSLVRLEDPHLHQPRKSHSPLAGVRRAGAGLARAPSEFDSPRAYPGIRSGLWRGRDEDVPGPGVQLHTGAGVRAFAHWQTTTRGREEGGTREPKPTLVHNIRDGTWNVIRKARDAGTESSAANKALEPAGVSGAARTEGWCSGGSSPARWATG